MWPFRKATIYNQCLGHFLFSPGFTASSSSPTCNRYVATGVRRKAHTEKLERASESIVSSLISLSLHLIIRNTYLCPFCTSGALTYACSWQHVSFYLSQKYNTATTVVRVGDLQVKSCVHNYIRVTWLFHDHQQIHTYVYTSLIVHEGTNDRTKNDDDEFYSYIKIVLLCGVVVRGTILKKWHLVLIFGFSASHQTRCNTNKKVCNNGKRLILHLARIVLTLATTRSLAFFLDLWS